MKRMTFAVSILLHLLLPIAANGAPALNSSEGVSVALSKIERKDGGKIWMSVSVHNGLQTPIYVYEDIVELDLEYWGNGDDWLKGNGILWVLPPDVLDFDIKRIDPGKTRLVTAEFRAKEQGNLPISRVSVSLLYAIDRRDFFLERQAALKRAQPLLVRFSGDSWRVVPPDEVKREKEKRKGKITVTKHDTNGESPEETAKTRTRQ